MLSLFPVPPPGNSLSHPASLGFYEGAPTPINPFLLPSPGIPLNWGINPRKDDGPLLPLIPDKSIFCYICSWNLGPLHVYSLVGVLVPGSSARGGGLVCWYCHSSYGVANLLSSFSPFSNSSIGDPEHSPMDACEHPHLHLLSSGRRLLKEAPTTFKAKV
jgi:hypothetical protein